MQCAVLLRAACARSVSCALRFFAAFFADFWLRSRWGQQQSRAVQTRVLSTREIGWMETGRFNGTAKQQSSTAAATQKKTLAFRPSRFEVELCACARCVSGLVGNGCASLCLCGASGNFQVDALITPVAQRFRCCRPARQSGSRDVMNGSMFLPAGSVPVKAPSSSSTLTRSLAGSQRRKSDTVVGPKKPARGCAAPRRLRKLVGPGELKSRDSRGPALWLLM